MPAKLFKRRVNSPYFESYYNAAAVPQLPFVRDFYTLWDDSRTASGPFHGWKRRIRENLSATTVLAGERVTLERYPTRGILHRSFYGYSGSKEYAPTVVRGYPDGLIVTVPPDPSTLSQLKATNQASLKFHRKVNEAKRAFQGGVWLGELRETLRMLRNPAKSLFDAARTDYLHKLNKLNRKVGKKGLAKALSGAWLEFAFGVQPLVSDINSAVDAFERLVEAPVTNREIVGTGRELGATSSVTGSASTAGDAKYIINVVDQQEVLVRYKGKYVRQVTKGQGLRDFQYGRELFGLEFDQFVPTLWELMPWSFLFDYFTNIGDILEVAVSSQEFVAWVNSTQRFTTSRMAAATPDVDWMKARTAVKGGFWDRYEVLSNGYCVTKRVAFARDKLSPDGLILDFELPGKPQKWLNMGALLAQAATIHPQRKFDR